MGIRTKFSVLLLAIFTMISIFGCEKSGAPDSDSTGASVAVTTTNARASGAATTGEGVGTGTRAGAGTGVTATPAANANKVTLLTWSDPAIVPYLNGMAARLKEKDGIILEVSETSLSDYPLTRLTHLMANNINIVAYNGGFLFPRESWNEDVMMNPPQWQDLAEAGIFKDISGEPFIDNYDEELLRESYGYKGSIYGLMAGVIPRNGVFYNIEKFEELGIAIPKTWDEFIDICGKIKAAGYSPIMIGGDAGTGGESNGNSGNGNSGNGNDNGNNNGNDNDNGYSGYNTGSSANAGSRSINEYASYIPVNVLLDEALPVFMALFLGEKKYSDPDIMVLGKMIEQFDSYIAPGAADIAFSERYATFAAEEALMLADNALAISYIEAASPGFKYSYFPLPGREERDDGLIQQMGIDFGYAMVAAAAAPNTDDAMKVFEFFSSKPEYPIFIDETGQFPTQPDCAHTNDFIYSMQEYMQKPSRIIPIYSLYGTY